MMLEVKRNRVKDYCSTHDCNECVLRNVWTNSNERNCLFIPTATRSELDWALTLINTSPKEQPDNVNHPAHYETGKFECIDVMVETQGEEAVKAYCLCAAFKYLYRHNRKNGFEDIKKARWYLDKYIEMEGGSDDKT